MLTEEKILQIAKQSADVAAHVLCLTDYDYSVELISNPELIEDGIFLTETNTVQINLAQLQPFTNAELAIKNCKKESDLPMILKIVYLTFHEMRHFYQKKAVEAYAVNQMMAGKMIPQPESDRKCELWLREMKGVSSEDTDIEADSDAFAVYLLHRYPMKLEWTGTNRRIGYIRRKYDKVGLPGEEE